MHAYAHVHMQPTDQSSSHTRAQVHQDNNYSAAQLSMAQRRNHDDNNNSSCRTNTSGLTTFNTILFPHLRLAIAAAATQAVCYQSTRAKFTL